MGKSDKWSLRHARGQTDKPTQLQLYTFSHQYVDDGKYNPAHGSDFTKYSAETTTLDTVGIYHQPESSPNSSISRVISLAPPIDVLCYALGLDECLVNCLLDIL